MEYFKIPTSQWSISFPSISQRYVLIYPRYSVECVWARNYNNRKVEGRALEMKEEKRDGLSRSVFYNMNNVTWFFCFFGAEKGLLQGQARRMGGSCSPNPELLKGFEQSNFKGKVREGSLRVSDQPVQNPLIVWCWSNREVNIINP